MNKKLFKGKKVLIMGLGLHGGGVEAARFFYKQGAEVLVTDLKPEEKLKESLEALKNLKIKYTLGRHEEEDFKWADLIIKNPDVPSSSPYLEIAKKNNIAIETDITLFFKLSGAYIIGVTGTKGKSTTSSLIYNIIKQKFKRVFLAGNIGVSPLKLLAKVRKGDKVVLELSSFELEDLKQSPNIAVITNIMQDHLNRYKDMTDYVEAKKIIFKYQTKNDNLVLNEDDFIVRQMGAKAIAKVNLVSAKKLPKDIDIKKFKLFGDHNLSNLALAIRVAEILNIDKKTIEKGIVGFEGVPSRQEFIREFNGVKYFNDTTATMPDAVVVAIKTFLENFRDSRLILICGGQNKGLEYNELSEVIKHKNVTLIMLPGTASEKIMEHLGGYSDINPVSSMQEAVLRAKELAKPKDVVVLSPGAASFNLFKNEFDRGRQFVEAVKNLK
jgi:UDP-N-acetylmuramoylalanine--D-glutamate ligase